MRPAAQCGVWRSPLSDTWPHAKPVEMDWWPQATHLVDATSGLVLCATGAGGGAQQAIFRDRLDPLLQRAHSRWLFDAARPAAVELDRLFAATQREFQELDDPPWAREFQASAVALLIGEQDCAIANVGVERAWLLRDGRLQRVSEDDSLGRREAAVPEFLRDQPASFFRKSPEHGPGWQVRPLPLREADVVLLAAGFSDLGVTEARLQAALLHVLALKDERVAPQPWLDATAQRLGQHLAETVSNHGDVEGGKRARWLVHSRLALAVVRVGQER